MTTTLLSLFVVFLAALWMMSNGKIYRCYYSPGHWGYRVSLRSGVGALHPRGGAFGTLMFSKRLNLGISWHKNFVIGWRGSALDLGWLAIFKGRQNVK